jgi:hypothetical protein
MYNCECEYSCNAILTSFQKVDGEGVDRQTEAEVLSKIAGPSGSWVVLHLRSTFSSDPFSVSLVRGDSPESMRLRQKLLNQTWPDPNTYDRTSVFGADLNNCFRQLCIYLLENWFWDKLVTAGIFISIATLPFDDPFISVQNIFIQDQRERSSTSGWAIDMINMYLSILFMIDVNVRIVASGFWMGKRAYMRDAFNRLDFSLSIIGLVDVFTDSTLPGMNAVKSIRALKVLKAINRFENLKAFIKLIFFTQEKLRDAMFVVLFMIFVFAIVSVQLFCGVLNQKCFHLESGRILDLSQPCSAILDSCPTEFACLLIGGPVSPSTLNNSNNFLFALMVNIQILTLTNWSELMYSYMSAYHPAAAVFFMLQIMILPVYCVQIFLAIIAIEIEPLQDHRMQARQFVLLNPPFLTSNALGMP